MIKAKLIGKHRSVSKSGSEDANEVEPRITWVWDRRKKAWMEKIEKPTVEEFSTPNGPKTRGSVLSRLDRVRVRVVAILARPERVRAEKVERMRNLADISGRIGQVWDMTRHRPVLIEIGVATVAILILIYVLRSLLLFGQTTIAHDSILWHYPAFQFFGESILNGSMPWWNPFSHGGEPFYLLFGQLRLLEPVSYLTVCFGHFFTEDLLTLFHWDRIIRGLIFAFGVYVLFRPWAKHLLIRLSLIPILLFSSITSAYLFQPAFIDQAIWVPYVAFFLLRIVYYKDHRWCNWFALAGFIGVSWQSYMFTGTWVFLLFMVLGLLIFRRDLVIGVFKTKAIWARLALLAAIVVAMALPNIILLFDRSDYVYPPRMIDYDYQDRTPAGSPVQYECGPEGLISSPLVMSYDFVRHTGTRASLWDFLQMTSPNSNTYFTGAYATIGWSGYTWGNPSEAYMYLGLLPLAIAILGLIVGRHELKRVWMLILAGLGLLMLGHVGGIHWLLYHIYPPLWFVRHPHQFVLIFLFCLLYFYILGANHLMTSWRHPFPDQGKSKGPLGYVIKKANLRTAIASLIFSVFLVLSIYFMVNLSYPATNYALLLVIPIFAVGWALRKDLGSLGLFGSLIASFLLVVVGIMVFDFRIDPTMFMVRTLIFLGIPMFLVLIMKELPGRSFVYVPIILLLILTCDLIQGFMGNSYVYNQLSPVYAGVDTTVNKPQFPETRLAYPPETFIYDQSMRYLPAVYRQAYALSPFSAVYTLVTIPMPFVEFKSDSFEYWSPSPGGFPLPEQWVYSQDGEGGFVEKRTADGVVKDSSASVRLSPSSGGNSTIRYEISDTEGLRGGFIRFSVWVKSQNTAPDAIQIDVQDLIGAPLVQSYSNSGGWEQIVLQRYIDARAERLLITINVKEGASDGAYLDGATIEEAPAYQPLTLAHGLNGSFEYWSPSPHGFPLPEQWVYSQDGEGGFVEECTADGVVKDSSASVRLSPSSGGNSTIRYEISDTEGLRGGGLIRFSVWVKSQNTAPDAIQIDVQDLIGAPLVQSYSNSGGWEQIVVQRYIDAHAERILLNINVKDWANDGAYLDGATIEIAAYQPLTLAHGLNGSFEYWSPSPHGFPLPEQWVYSQDGEGGFVEKCTADDAVKDSSASVRLSPSSEGNSMIRYEISDTEGLRGGFIRFSVWVKSQNTAPDAIQIDVQDLIGAPLVQSYSNSGGWEQIVLQRYIDARVERLLITINVRDCANDGAYFDGASIEEAPAYQPLRLAHGLNGSFEYWSPSPHGFPLPEQWVYSQGGEGGFVEECTADGVVKDSSASVRLSPSSGGNSTIRYEISDTEGLRGGFIRFSVWVKSQNTAPDAIQIDVQDLIGAPLVQSYSNSGGWEQIVLQRYIDAHAERILLNINVKDWANDGAYLDGATIEIAAYKPLALAHGLNGSFEYWSPSPHGFPLPEQWVYSQDGEGGFVEKRTADDVVKDSSASVRLSPSSRGNSMLRYEISDTEGLRGGFIRFSVWVKSQNTAPDAIQVDVQDLIGPPASPSYSNSGGWEQIVVQRHIDAHAERILLTMNVKDWANDGAYFDGATIEISAYKPLTLAYGLNGRRWSSFFLPGKYFDLIHSDISPPVLAEMFAIDRPLLQFKQGFLEIEDGNITTYLSQLGEEESVRLLEGTVIISGPVGSELVELEGPFSASKEGNFAYSIERYDYNSLLMRVDSESDGLLYWADGYDKNWHAFVDGVEVPIYRANIAFKAIQLPEGESEVSFVYDPFWFKIGLYVFFGLEIVCLLGFLIGLRKQSAGGVLR